MNEKQSLEKWMNSNQKSTGREHANNDDAYLSDWCESIEFNLPATQSQVLRAIRQQVLIPNPLDATLEAILNLLVELVPYQQADIILYDHDNEEIQIISAVTSFAYALAFNNRLPISFSNYPLKPQWRSIHVINNVKRMTDLSPMQRSLQANGIQTLLTVPLVPADTLLGYLILGSLKPQVYSAEQSPLLEEITYLITLCLQQHQLQYQLKQQAEMLGNTLLLRNDELQKLADELENSNRFKNEFIAATNHELRTPLNAILGKAAVLTEDVYGSLNEKQHRAASVIQESGTKLLQLINNLLDWTDIETDRVEFKIEPIQIQTLCSQILAPVYAGAAEKGLQFNVNMPSSPLWIAVDQSRFERVLLILLDNALKFTPNGGEIGLDVKKVNGDGQLLRLVIWDTGIGIPAEKMSMLFLPFTQLDGQFSRQYEGVGLGLPLAYRLVQLHEGELTIISRPNQGTRITITLPLVTSDKDIIT